MMAKHNCFNEVLWYCNTCKNDVKSSQACSKNILQLISDLQSRMQKLEEKHSTSLDNNCPRSSFSVPQTITPEPISHQVYIIPKENGKLTVKSFCEIAKTNLPNVPIKRMGVTKEGHGYIRVPDKEASDEIINKLGSEYNTVAKTTSQREFLPKITISDIDSEHYTNKNKDELKSAILNKNQGIKTCVEDKKQFEILFLTKDRSRDNFSKAVVRVHPDILQVIKRSRYKIFIDFGTCRVSDRFFLKQCYRCQKFGHHKEDCSMKAENKNVCRFCSDNHESSACSIKGSTNTEKFKCANCFGNHSTTDVSCPVLQRQVEYLVSRTKGFEGLEKNSIPRYAIIT